MKCDEVKKKVAEKVTKGKAKVAKKCGKGKTAGAVALAILAVCGCQAPAQRAMTARTEVNVFGGNVTFGSEFVSQAQANETGGSETFSPTQTTDTKPDVDVTVGGKASGGLLEAAAGKLISPSAAAPAAAAPTAEAVDCPDCGI